MTKTWLFHSKAVSHVSCVSFFPFSNAAKAFVPVSFTLRVKSKASFMPAPRPVCAPNFHPGMILHSGVQNYRDKINVLQNIKQIIQAGQRICQPPYLWPLPWVTVTLTKNGLFRTLRFQTHWVRGRENLINQREKPWGRVGKLIFRNWTTAAGIFALVDHIFCPHTLQTGENSGTPCQSY